MRLRTQGKPIEIDPVYPNLGVEVWYRHKLQKFIQEMHSDAMEAIAEIYDETPPHSIIAQDASPARKLRKALRSVAHRSKVKAGSLAEKVAKEFAQEALHHAESRMEHLVSKAEFRVKFQMSKRMNDGYQAVVGENVSLIKSIAAEHLADVEQEVMRSVQHGRSMKDLTEMLGDKISLKRKPGENDKSILARTQRHAAFIARDQNNKATALITKIRRVDLGITQSKWVHTTASKKPRESHESMNGKIFDTEVGCWDYEYGDFIQPGELCECGCVAIGIIPGLEDETEEIGENR